MYNNRVIVIQTPSGTGFGVVWPLVTLGRLSYGHYWQQHFGRGPFVCGWPSVKVPDAEDTYVLPHVETGLLFLLTLATVTICQQQ